MRHRIYKNPARDVDRKKSEVLKIAALIYAASMSNDAKIQTPSFCVDQASDLFDAVEVKFSSEIEMSKRESYDDRKSRLDERKRRQIEEIEEQYQSELEEEDD